MLSRLVREAGESDLSCEFLLECGERSEELFGVGASPELPCELRWCANSTLPVLSMSPTTSSVSPGAERLLGDGRGGSSCLEPLLLGDGNARGDGEVGDILG
mmetsp:Transcript_43694/g.94835  ORF Transcript_43694/g.94835 Transcript_43694/m.94835 type:complete len:102 (+) Transcript_43694:286-591(+)